MNRFRKFLFLSFITCFTSIVYSQQTQIDLDKESAFKKGIELFDEKNFLSAREKFEEIYQQKNNLQSNGNAVLLQNLEYYIAVCAAETNDKDAEQLLSNYIKKHHETDKRRKIYLYLGKYYFRNKQYSSALEHLAKVKINDLNNEQIYEYRFMLAYSYFTKKKFKEAKPLFHSIREIRDKYYYPSNYYYAFICFYNKEYNEALKVFESIQDTKMYASVIPYYISQIYFLKKDYDKLIPYAKGALVKDGVLYKDEIRFLLGKSFFMKADYSNAVDILKDYIAQSGRAAKEDFYQLGYALYQTKQYLSASENLKQVSSLDEPLGQNASFALADCYLHMNKKEEARSAFRNAAKNKYDETIRQHALYNFAKLSFELNYTSEAIESFEDYLVKFPSGNYVDDVNEMLATALVQTKNYERAYRMLDKMNLASAMLKEAFQKVTYFRAVELFNDNQHDLAAQLCDKSLKYALNTELNALAIYLKGEIFYGKGDYENALQNFQRFAQIVTGNFDAKGEASKFRAYYNKGYCAFKQKRYSDAALYFNEAIDESKTSADKKGKQALLPDLYLRFADCAFVTKNYPKAIDAYTEIVSKKWSNADYAQFQKAIILGLQSKEEEKIAALSDLIRIFPGSNYAVRSYYETGETFLQLSNNEQARSAYQSIITLFPNSELVPDCYMRVGAIDYNTGKKEAAIENYKLVVKKFPQTNKANEALEALKEIYVEMGRADEFFEFAQNSNVSISSSEQDSLTYIAAANAYNGNDCPRSITLFANYITKFPKGFFINDAHWKKSDCHLKQKDFTKALEDFDALIQNKYSKYYEKALLKGSGIAFYEANNFEKALGYYRQLQLVSSSQQNTYTAMIGMLNCAVRLNYANEILEYADQLINSGMAKEPDIQEAHFQKGKIWYAKNEKQFARAAFNHVTEFPVSEKAVEAKYMVAKILNEEGNYKPSLDTCTRLKNKYASYEYWVVKTFILMSDNYAALGNTFQAKATLESIVQNYDGNAALLNEAKEKLDQLKSEDLRKSKLIPESPADTLIMENDSILMNK